MTGTLDRGELARRLTLDRFPRSAGYDPVWAIENEMGPNPLWLAEFLVERLPLEPGMRVLDLGCGRASSSIFLARELGVEVWAADLWVDPTDNLARIDAAGVADRVFPLRVEAHALPFAHAFFDAVVCLDAYQYFGTDETYLAYLVRRLRPEGRVGIVVPGLTREFDDDVPERLRPHWDPEWFTWHSAAWWSRLWRRSGTVEVEIADTMPDGWATWLHWEVTARDSGLWQRGGDVDLLEADGGENLTFTRVVARRLGNGE